MITITITIIIMTIAKVLINEDWPRDRSHFLGGIPSIPDLGQTLMTMLRMTMLTMTLMTMFMMTFITMFMMTLLTMTLSVVTMLFMILMRLFMMTMQLLKNGNENYFGILYGL